MKKICNILYSGLGGCSDVCNVLGKIDDHIETLSFFILVGPKRYINYVSKKNQSNYFVKTYRFISFFYFYPVLQILIKEKPDLVILHNYQILPVFFYKFLVNKKFKVIYADHAPNNLKKFKDYFVTKFFSLLIDFYVVLNKESYKYLLNKININKKKIIIIPNSLNPTFILKKIKKRTNFKSLNIGMAARINDNKRHDLIIDTIQNNLLRNIKIKCFFAGDGEKINFYKRKTANSKNFFFSGPLYTVQLKKWYQKLDLYVQASNGEGHSTSILQAMGMNLPVLGSNVSGIKNFLSEKKKIGIVFDNNQKSLSRKINYFFKLPQNKKNKIIKSQKKYMLNYYTEHNFLNSYKKVINKLIFTNK